MILFILFFFLNFETTAKIHSSNEYQRSHRLSVPNPSLYKLNEKAQTSSLEELHKHSRALSDLLLKKKKSKICFNKATSKKEHFCRLYNHLQRYYLVKNSKTVQKKILNLKNIGKLQSTSLQILKNQMPRVSNLKELSQKALATKSCPRNLSLHLRTRYEWRYPQSEAIKLSEKLYKHASHCLKKSDDNFHKTHFRQALLRSLWSKKLAKKSITTAAQGQINSNLVGPINYWAGFLAGDTLVRDYYWAKVLESAPLSLHALLVWNKWELDPLKELSKNPVVSANPRNLSSAYFLDGYLFWAQVLSKHNMLKSLKELVMWLRHKYNNELSIGNKVYLLSLIAPNNNTLNSMHYLGTASNIFPEILNKITLKKIFPIKHKAIFKSYSGSVDPHLLIGLSKQESSFNPKAISSAKAVGLMQILPSTAKTLTKLKHINLFSPALNVKLGSRYIDQLNKRFGNMAFALSAYNAGPSRVNRWKKRYGSKHIIRYLDLIPIEETRDYVPKVLTNNYWYQRLYKKKNQRQAKVKSAIVQQLIADSRI